jgi:hypothetical protein
LTRYNPFTRPWPYALLVVLAIISWLSGSSTTADPWGVLLLFLRLFFPISVGLHFFFLIGMADVMFLSTLVPGRPGRLIKIAIVSGMGAVSRWKDLTGIYLLACRTRGLDLSFRRPRAAMDLMIALMKSQLSLSLLSSYQTVLAFWFAPVEDWSGRLIPTRRRWAATALLCGLGSAVFLTLAL